MLMKNNKKDKLISVKPAFPDDSIFQIGKNPVECDIKDGSKKHDNYIYRIIHGKNN